MREARVEAHRWTGPSIERKSKPDFVNSGPSENGAHTRLPVWQRRSGGKERGSPAELERHNDGPHHRVRLQVEYPRRCLMIQTVEAVIDDTGRVHLLGEIHVTSPRR